MGLFDWLGPLNAGGKRRGWDALPSPVSERKAGDSWTISDMRAALTVNTLTHGPGSRELLAGHRNADGNSAVYACLQIIATALAEPPLRVYRVRAGERVEQDGTPLGELLARPNPHLTMAALLGYLSTCLHVDGNAYWRKLRAGNDLTGNVVELWPISPSAMKPITTGGSGDFISYYRYYVRPGVYEDIPPENIVHFRMGIDDADHRLGLAPLKRLLREVSSDEAATFYADTLLSHLATPGLYAEFDKDAPAIDQAQADELKRRIAALYGGGNAGSVGVGSPGMKLSQIGFSPEQMDLKVLHRVPEERIAAVLGVPAVVAGLGAGLDRSTYSNFAEAREAFTEMKLVPFWRSIADTVTMALAPDFASSRDVVAAFDLGDVRALQADEDARAARLQVYVSAGILDVDEARAEIGRAPRSPARPADAAPGGSPPATRSRAPLRMLRKALDDLPGQFDMLKDAAEGDWEDALRTFLEQQLRRITRALRDGADTAEGLVAEGEAVLLGDLLTPRQLALFEDVRGLVVAELGFDFEIDDALTREYLRAAGANITGITQTTREAVRAALIEGQAAGEGIPQLSARLRELSAFGRSRAVTVARTELGHAANTAALANYRASGVVVGVRVFDGDYDAVCQAMNGRVYALGQEPATLQHPRCRRAFAPIVDAAEMERSA
jgi:HK97 family phage portal protein